MNEQPTNEAEAKEAAKRLVRSIEKEKAALAEMEAKRNAVLAEDAIEESTDG